MMTLLKLSSPLIRSRLKVNCNFMYKCSNSALNGNRILLKTVARFCVSQAYIVIRKCQVIRVDLQFYCLLRRVFSSMLHPVKGVLDHFITYSGRHYKSNIV